VALDSPVGAHLGGEVAGPVFKRVAEQVLPYLDVAHDVPPGAGPGDAVVPAKASRKASEKDSLTAKKHGGDPAGVAVNAASAQTQLAAQAAGSTTTVEFGGDAGIAVPSFTGTTVRSVTEACVKLGLTPILIGNGVAAQQTPEAGARIARGGQVTVRFERRSGGVSAQPRKVPGSISGTAGTTVGTSIASSAGPSN
jgi:hypothetical protein